MAGVDYCVDYDECSHSNDCHEGATCTNTVGNYTCICNEGFRGTGKQNRFLEQIVIYSFNSYDLKLPLVLFLK